MDPYKQKKTNPDSLSFLSAQNWIRTSTSLRTLRPEHSASTNFAIWADEGLKVSGQKFQVLLSTGSKYRKQL